MAGLFENDRLAGSPGFDVSPQMPQVPAPNIMGAPTAAPEIPKIDMEPMSTPGVNKNSTVSGQMESLFNTDSPYMKLAQNYANEQMNSRGLMNSSLGVNAAHQAAISAGLPIAQQDANTYFTQARANQDATNQQKMARYSTALNEHAASHTAGLDMQKMGYGTALDATKMGYASQLSNAENAYKNLLQKDYGYFQSQVEAGLMSHETALKERLATVAGNIEAELKNVDSDNALKLAQLNNQWRQLGEITSGATALYNTTLEALYNAMMAGAADETINVGDGSSGVISELIGNLSAGLDFISALNGQTA